MYSFPIVILHLVEAKRTGVFPVWYIGVIDIPYTENREVCTVLSSKI